MKQLLDEIEKLKNSEVKKLVDSRTAEFKELGKKSDDEIFSELCFCILTANFNAERSMKIQNEIKGGFCYLPQLELAERLKTLGHRFPETRANYIVKAREHKDSLKGLFRKFKSETELREWLAKNVKGLGYKESSLPHYEKILTIIDGTVNLIEIGSLFHQYVNGGLKGKKLETFSFNHKTLKFEIVPISDIMRHRYKKDLYKIHLKLGRSVSVTGDHSVFTIKDGEILPIEVRKLKTGDFIAVPRRLPLINCIIKELNIVDEFIKRNIFDNFYLRGKEYCNFLRENYGKKIKRKNQYVQHFRGIIPLKVITNLPKEAYDNNVLKKFKVKLSYRTSPNTVKTIIQLNKDFFWLLGLFIAEASIGRNPIEITLGLEEYRRFLKVNNLLSRVFGVTIKKYRPKHRNVYISKVHNLGFFYLIKDVLDIRGYSISKRIPKIVFSSGFSNISSFLQGYWEGDGWKKSKSYFSVSTNSDELASDLLSALLMVGVNARFCRKQSRGFKHTIANTIDFNCMVRPSQLKNKIFINKTEVIPNVGKLTHIILKNLKIKTKVGGKHTDIFEKVMRWKHINQPSRENLRKFINKVEKYGTCEELRKLKRLVNSNLSFVRIKKIKKIPYRNNYVYDLSVAKSGKNFQNFVGGFGGVCLHNSHFLRNIGFTDVAIVDFHIIDLLVKHKLIERPKTLTPKKYLEIENLLRTIAKKSGLNLAELDLYLWYMETGKVLK